MSVTGVAEQRDRGSYDGKIVTSRLRSTNERGSALVRHDDPKNEIEKSAGPAEKDQKQP